MMRNNEYNYLVDCEWCGNTFHSSRSHTKYCSAGCRAKSHRSALKRSQSVERIKRQIDALLMDCPLEVADSLAREIQAYAAVYEVRTVGDK